MKKLLKLNKNYSSCKKCDVDKIIIDLPFLLSAYRIKLMIKFSKLIKYSIEDVIVDLAQKYFTYYIYSNSSRKFVI